MEVLVKVVPVSLYLFNIFVEVAIEKLKERSQGIKITGQNIHCLRLLYVSITVHERDINLKLN